MDPHEQGWPRGPDPKHGLSVTQDCELADKVAGPKLCMTSCVRDIEKMGH